MFTLKTWNSVTKRPKKGENTCQGLNGRFQKLILKESGEGVGGEAERGGPGLQNGPPQPGPRFTHLLFRKGRFKQAMRIQM